ncbi:hypothetical protein LFADAHJC_LOCUS1151 [Methylorubrum extorquens]
MIAARTKNYKKVASAYFVAEPQRRMSKVMAWRFDKSLSNSQDAKNAVTFHNLQKAVEAA